MSTSLVRRNFLHFQLTLLALFLIICSQRTCADELAVWNFNDSNLLVDHGSGTLTTSVAAANISFAAGTATNSREILQGSRCNCREELVLSITVVTSLSM
jgi:hypothetical protein